MLNLVESRDRGGPRADRGAAGGASPRPRSAARRRPTSSASPGRPGVGKSSLLSRLVAEWRAARPLGGGAGRRPELAALGRLAARRPGPDRASTPPTGRCSSARPPPATGSAAWPRPPARPPARWPCAFDVVVIETVGVGQSETEVADVADTVAVVVQPGSGDVLQFLKAGIMEVPDVLVVTKADLGRVATRALSDLQRRAAVAGRRRHRGAGGLVGRRRPSGIDELVDALDAPPRRARPAGPARCAAGACTRWPTSSPSTASAACARSAAGARPSAGCARAGPRAPTWPTLRARALERAGRVGEPGDAPADRARAGGSCSRPSRWSTARPRCGRGATPTSRRWWPPARTPRSSRWTRVPAPTATPTPARYLLPALRHGVRRAGARRSRSSRAADGELLGLDLADADRLGARSAAEVGYWLAARGPRPGHATRAVRLICAWGFADARPRADRPAGRDRQPRLAAGGRARRLHPRGGAALVHARAATSARTWSPSACWPPRR